MLSSRESSACDFDVQQLAIHTVKDSFNVCLRFWSRQQILCKHVRFAVACTTCMPKFECIASCFCCKFVITVMYWFSWSNAESIALLLRADVIYCLFIFEVRKTKRCSGDWTALIGQVRHWLYFNRLSIAHGANVLPLSWTIFVYFSLCYYPCQ